MKSIIVVLACVATLTQGRILTCEFSDSTLPIVNLVYLCRGRISSVDSNVIERVEGVHLANRNNVNVTALAITEQLVVDVPRNLAATFPNLKSVDFSNAQILTISSTSLSGLRNLVFFRLLNNQVQSIEGNLFSSNLQLQYIDFRRNSLETVGGNLLGSLKLLIDVNFLGNKCIDVRASSPQAIDDLNQQLPVRCPLRQTTTTTVAPVTTTAPVSTTAPVTTTAPVSTTTTVSGSTVPTVPTAPTASTEAPKCTVPCAEIDELKSKIAEQAKIIADLERRLQEVGP